MARAVVLLLLVFAAALPAAAADPLDPTEAPVSVRRAVFRAEKAAQNGDLDEARDILADAVAAGGDRDHPAVRYRLGVYLLELEQPTEALPHLRAASEQAPEAAMVWRELGRAAYESGELAEAGAAFEMAYRRQVAAEAEPELLYYSGIAWILADRPENALDVLEPLVAAAPDTVPREWVRALVSAAAGADAPDRAEAGIERLLRDHPSDAESWRLASQVAQLSGDMPLAAVRSQVAAWLDDSSDIDLRRLAELQAAAGAPRQAARVYAQLWDEGRGETGLAEPLAITWLQAHEPDSARVVLDAVLIDEPSTRLYMLLGDLEYGVDRWDAAARAYGQAAELSPDNGRAWLMRAASEARAARYDEAMAYLRRAVNDPAVADEARRLMAQLERRSG